MNNEYGTIKKLFIKPFSTSVNYHERRVLLKYGDPHKN